MYVHQYSDMRRGCHPSRTVRECPDLRSRFERKLCCAWTPNPWWLSCLGTWNLEATGGRRLAGAGPGPDVFGREARGGRLDEILAACRLGLVCGRATSDHIR